MTEEKRSGVRVAETSYEAKISFYFELKHVILRSSRNNLNSFFVLSFFKEIYIQVRTDMDSTTDDIISIPLPEKRRRFLSFAKCIICQVDKPDVLRKAKASSIAVFVRSLQLRKDEVYDRLSEEISNLCDREVVWHSSCYSSYTSEHNIQHATGAGKVDIQDTSNTSNRTAHIGLRSSSNVSIDWSKCFICRNRTYTKCREMNNVSTFEACKCLYI